MKFTIQHQTKFEKFSSQMMTIKNSKHENVMLNDNIEQNLQILMNNNKRTGQKSSQQSILMRTSEYSQMNRKYFRPLSVFRRRTSLLFLSLMLLMAQIPLGASDEHEHIVSIRIDFVCL